MPVDRSHRQLPFWVALAMTTALLLWPENAVPEGPPVSDKLMHALLFATLALTGAVARFPMPALAAGLLGYAAVTELLQRVLPINRHGDLRDLLADAIGVGAGLVVTVLLGVRRESERADQ